MRPPARVPDPWSLRLATATGERAALEIYDDEDLVDVMVAPALAGRVLRGARAATRAGRHQVLAWGYLPADGTPLAAAFVGRRAVRRVHPVPVTGIGGRFWVAAAEGRFRKVIVTFGYSAAHDDLDRVAVEVGDPGGAQRVEEIVRRAEQADT